MARLVEALDAYMANTKNYGKPRIPVFVPQMRSGVNFGNGKKVLDVPKQPTGKVEPVILQKPVPVPRSGVGRRCFICSSPSHMCPQRSGCQANKFGQKLHVNTCMAKPRGEKVNYAESARDDAEIRKINPRGHLESPQVKEDDVKVNDVELAVSKMTVEDEGDNVIEDGKLHTKGMFF